MTLRDFDPAEFFRTTDMGLAAYLKMEGFTPQQVLWDEESCYWLFRLSDALNCTTDAYLGGHALVDPKRYNGVYGDTKKEFHRANDGRPGMRAAV